MSGTVFMSLASLFFIIIIMISYFSKERNNNSETKIFTKLLIISFCSLLSELYIVILPKNMDFFPFVFALKLLLIFCLLWITYFMEYVFIITRNNEDKVLIEVTSKHIKQQCFDEIRKNYIVIGNQNLADILNEDEDLLKLIN